jgi:hypothetical protein
LSPLAPQFIQGHTERPGETSAPRGMLGADACRLRFLSGHSTSAYL